MARLTCEENLFDWSECDFITDAVVLFYDSTLKVEIGEFDKGTKFGGILVDTENSQIVLQNYAKDGEMSEEHAFSLSYRVGEKIERVY